MAREEEALQERWLDQDPVLSKDPTPSCGRRLLSSSLPGPWGAARPALEWGAVGRDQEHALAMLLGGAWGRV